jgi:hypothetical protein
MLIGFSLIVVVKKPCSIQTIFLQPLIPQFRIGNIIMESGITQKEALIPLDEHLI